MMIAYGPAEDAEIALGIVIEYGGGGAAPATSWPTSSTPTTP